MSDGKTRRYMNEREWQCFEDGVKYERERLIKLLEQDLQAQDVYYHGAGTDWLNPCGVGCECHTHKVENLIAQIKGEN